jgi:hypothetical protein
VLTVRTGTALELLSVRGFQVEPGLLAGVQREANSQATLTAATSNNSGYGVSHVLPNNRRFICFNP